MGLGLVVRLGLGASGVLTIALSLSLPLRRALGVTSPGRPSPYRRARAAESYLEQG